MALKTLAQRRKYWEQGEIVGRWYFPRQHFHITIQTNYNNEFQLIRYFKIGEGYEASVDLDKASAADVFKRLAYLLDGQEEII